jgi:GT2 family glycosyltransferase
LNVAKASGTTPLVSVVMATFNRRDTLAVTLERLSTQTFPPEQFEVVLVDDGSADGTPEMIAEIQPKLPFELRYFRHSSNEGPGAAHNHGAREARAEIILFLADDMHATPPVVESHHRHHSLHTARNVAFVGKLRESKEMPQTAFQQAWNPFRGGELDGKEELGEFDFWISNLSMKRQFFLQHGVFLERTGASVEDLELSHRLFKEGMVLKYNPEALTYHYHPQTIDSAVARVYETGRNFHIYEEDVVHDEGHRSLHVLSSRLAWPARLRVLLRDMARLSVFNRVTVPGIVIPLIRRAEDYGFLRPFVGFLTSRSMGYYFRRGVSEGRRPQARKK